MKNVNKIKQYLTEFYNKNASEYHRINYIKSRKYSPSKFRQHYIERMIEFQKISHGARILDVGCGPGELTASLLQKRYDVWGIDISPAMVAATINILKKNNLLVADRISVDDAENLEFDDNFFDVAVAAGVIEYQLGDEKLLSEMRRIIKKDGYLIINIRNRYAYTTILDNSYLWFKRQSMVMAFRDFINNKFLRRVRGMDIPDFRTHLPSAFDRLLAKYGFKKISYNYFSFSPIPVPLNYIFGKFSMSLGKHMEKLTRSPMAPLLAGGYLVMARKER